MMRDTLDPEEVETRVLHSLVDFHGKDVVEVGCGDGRLTWRYAHHAASVLAFDPELEMIELAREQMPQESRPRVELRASDVEGIDLSEGAFDIALLSWSLC